MNFRGIIDEYFESEANPSTFPLTLTIKNRDVSGIGVRMTRKTEAFHWFMFFEPATVIAAYFMCCVYCHLF
jgi:hypothetical protein